MRLRNFVRRLGFQMARFGRLPGKMMVSEPTGSSFDLTTVLFGDRESTGRPYEFVDDIDNPGGVIATKLSSSCPECGHGVIVEVTGVRPSRGACGNCGLGAEKVQEPLVDPFFNPVLSGIISQAEINPSFGQHDVSAVPQTTAFERLKAAGHDEIFNSDGNLGSQQSGGVLGVGEEQDIS